jgi:ABC-2 type transport system ATP-binding protein
MSLIEFQNIRKIYNKREILSDISFNIEEKEIFGLVGRSGGGKTTLLKVLIGMTRADDGNILFESRNALKKLDYLRRNTGFASQENMLFDELSIRENSIYFGKLYGMKRKEIKQRLSELLGFLGLEGFENILVSKLSGGMVKRANLLVSLIHSPKLLILDEPTVGLDPILRKTLWLYIHKINLDGTTILVTSHLLDEIEENCNRVAFIDRGKIAEIGTINDLKEKYGKEMSFNEIFQTIMRR